LAPSSDAQRLYQDKRNEKTGALHPCLLFPLQPVIFHRLFVWDNSRPAGFGWNIETVEVRFVETFAVYEP
jgi:hypothetical protein